MKNSQAIRVIIADDHPVVRDGLNASLAADPQIEVVGAAASFRELAEVLQDLWADVLVLDIGGMGDESPLLTVERLKHQHRDLAIIVFSSSIDMVPEMLAAGATGYVAKEELSGQLRNAIRVVRDGHQFLSPLAEQYVTRCTTRSAQQPLARQEVTVLKLLAKGLSTREIADHLGIDTRTVHNYVQKLLRKTGCTLRTQLVTWYRRVYG